MNTEIPIYRQCELLGLTRSSYYYSPGEETEYNLMLMKLIDEEYTKTPFYGARSMTTWLRRGGHPVNRKRMQRLMRLMGIEAVYPKPRLSIASKDHRNYPYLLRNLTIERPDQAWCADITYVRLVHGYVYLVAIMDWYSRYVLAWELSNTMDTEFCMKALERALRVSKPDIFNTDQGSQFTSLEFTGKLEGTGIRISMDGRGRVFDNIFIERLWRTVKYEEVYLHDYRTVREVHSGLKRYFQFYNRLRFHSSLDDKTPYEVYSKKEATTTEQVNNSIHLKQPCFLS